MYISNTCHDDSAASSTSLVTLRQEGSSTAWWSENPSLRRV